MHGKFYFKEDLDLEDFSEEEVGGLSIGDDVLFTPDKDDPICVDEIQLAAKVAWVNDDNTVNLTVFCPSGETVSRKNVIQLKFGDVAPEEGHFCQDSYFAIIDQEEEFDNGDFWKEGSEDDED